MEPKARTNGRLIALFILGVLLFSPLTLRIFDAGADHTLAGVPALVIYVFTAWGFLIALIALAARALDTYSDDEPPAPTDAESGPLPPVT